MRNTDYTTTQINTANEIIITTNGVPTAHAMTPGGQVIQL